MPDCLGALRLSRSALDFPFPASVYPAKTSSSSSLSFSLSFLSFASSFRPFIVALFSLSLLSFLSRHSLFLLPYPSIRIFPFPPSGLVVPFPALVSPLSLSLSSVSYSISLFDTPPPPPIYPLFFLLSTLLFFSIFFRISYTVSPLFIAWSKSLAVTRQADSDPGVKAPLAHATTIGYG